MFQPSAQVADVDTYICPGKQKPDATELGCLIDSEMS